VIGRSLRGMIVVFVLATLAGALTVALAQSIDPHRLYEQRCSGCHAMHASEFVRDSLKVADGKLVGRRSGREVLTFLESGHRRLTGAEAKAMVAQLTSIEASDGLYQQKCRICHDRAVNLARTELIIMGGQACRALFKARYRDISRWPRPIDCRRASNDRRHAETTNRYGARPVNTTSTDPESEPPFRTRFTYPRFRDVEG